ncbi:hypothetical protein BOX15_Mlig011066g4 [Macrostomum lignano]|uniref:Class II aldolase/adducin N-terminal domain-containing protein n=2 Tax=Macrostomum lignano TaxID=282301 RepID=A0A267DHF2_9PLAT|nr:hypothetical protein BOX15_Mlig011066g5 [Macrostomum lignano]PAA49422.1 hypothetical protein BOX15_Mlig011066g4 [Macrostomum lignano]
MLTVAVRNGWTRCRLLLQPVAFGIRQLSGNRGATTAAQQNWQARVDLAAAYRALDQLGYNEGICNHLSLMTPSADGSGAELMLLVPYGLHWSRVRASDLVGLDAAGRVVEGNGRAETSAATIHRPLHEARPEAKAVFHLHSPYATALSCLQDSRLRMVHQNCLYFLNSIAYDLDYSGVSVQDSEGARLASCLAPDKTCLMMANHGYLVLAETAAMAFHYSYYLERCAMYQLLAMQTGRELKELDPAFAKAAQQDMLKFAERDGDQFFRAVQQKLRDEGSDFEK